MSEQNLVVYRDVTGDIREGSDKELILSRIQRCQDDIRCLKQRYIFLGGHLNDLKPYAKDVWNLAKGRWCKDVYELAEHCFGFKKSATANMIAVTKRFGEYMTSLKPEYSRYNYSCLCEMLPLTDEQLKLCTPEMTESEIRALRKTLKSPVQLTGQNVDNSKISYGNCVLALKNDKERIEFLRQYKSWGKWLSLPELALNFYKCDLTNGDFIVATENVGFHKDKKIGPWVTYCIVYQGTSKDSYFYDTYAMSTTNILSYIKSSSVKFIVSIDCEDFADYLNKTSKK